MPTTGSLQLIEDGGVKAVEGAAGQPLMTTVEDTTQILEACFSNQVQAVLLYAENMTDGFFDLSSGQAGAMLQRLRNYGIRLAVVCPADSVRFSTHFGEMLAEEQRGRYFGIFESRRAALEWLDE